MGVHGIGDTTHRLTVRAEIGSARTFCVFAAGTRSLIPSTLLPPPVTILYGRLKRWAVRSASDRHRRVPLAGRDGGVPGHPVGGVAAVV